jgi:type I restriction enzyme, R subunit
MILSNDKPIEGLRIDEKTHVENPLLEQLDKQGWTVLRLDRTQTPSESFRTSFAQVVLLPKLEEALSKINPFLRDDQTSDVVRKITSFPQKNLIENNQQVLQYLLENTTVSINHETGEDSPTVRYVDFENRANNSFIAISQFKVSVLGTEHHIIPDLVLFLNGLPIAVIECKSPKVKEPIPEAIDQMLRYSQQRGDSPEGNAELFYYNQFLVATCRQQAKFGTITTHIEKHFFRWTDPYPLTLNDLPHEGTAPNDQQRLVAGMCSKDNLLDLIRSFTIFTTNDKGKTIKIVGRYQQFRAVKLTLKRLREGRNSRERSGIIWHTQGSGKSLTMVFMVREMRQYLEFSDWKIIFVTDRTQLQQQLGDTSKGIGYKVKEGDSIRKLRDLIKTTSPDLIMAMMQKFQERDLHEIFPELNSSPKILLMIDEAHRTQYQLLGANLDRAMPNAARVAYTGTPIDKTEVTFGDYIDKYTMRQSIEDGTTLEIVYEGRTHNAELPDREGMDLRFEDVFSEYRLSERLQILGYGAREAYLEAKDTIKAKALDLIDHYTQYVFPDGFKAQVVAVSREAATRYKTYIDEALGAKVAELEMTNPLCIDVDRLRSLETAVVISGSHNDLPHIKAYIDENYHKRSIRRFKLPFDAEDKEGEETFDGHVGIIIVNNMLVTGFDAPIEQVLYLDKVVTDHNLLQTIARVNRVADENKDKGFVIDYVGIGHHIKQALAAYDEREQQEILAALGSPDKDLNELIQAHREIWALLHKYGLKDFSDPDAFFDLFHDEDIRFEYILAFKKLTHAFNLVLPRKEALTYFKDYESFCEINALANKHLRDSRLSMTGIPPKLRAITDEFLKSKGIQQKIAPISILDADFQKDVKARKRSKTKAAEVEHAIRHFINLNVSEDPELFASFASELEKILQEFRDNWDRIYQELEKLRQKMAAKEKEQTYGLDRKKQMPIFRMLRVELFDGHNLSEDEIAQTVNLTQNLSNLIVGEIVSAGFWSSTPAQNRLKAELQQLMLSEEFSKYPNMMARWRPLITRLMEWARENHGVLARA